jgi:hypothetical protein
MQLKKTCACIDQNQIVRSIELAQRKEYETRPHTDRPPFVLVHGPFTHACEREREYYHSRTDTPYFFFLQLPGAGGMHACNAVFTRTYRTRAP